VQGKDSLDDAPTRRGQGDQDHPAVVGGVPAAHQAPGHELVHDVRSARGLDQDAALHIAHRQLTLVVQDFQHTELRRAQSETGDARARVMVHGVERPGQDDPQLQGSLMWLRWWWHLVSGTAKRVVVFLDW